MDKIKKIFTPIVFLLLVSNVIPNSDGIDEHDASEKKPDDDMKYRDFDPHARKYAGTFKYAVNNLKPNGLSDIDESNISDISDDNFGINEPLIENYNESRLVKNKYIGRPKKDVNKSKLNVDNVKQKLLSFVREEDLKPFPSLVPDNKKKDKIIV